MVDDGVTGFLVESVDGAVDAITRLDELDRHAIRLQFEARFSVGRMAQDYVAIYRNLLAWRNAPTQAALSGNSAA